MWLHTIVATALLAGSALSTPLHQPASNSSSIVRRHKSHNSPNWAGAVQHSKEVTKVHGRAWVSKAETPSVDGMGSYSGAAWVGIDGSGKDPGCDTILQTGIGWDVFGEDVSYNVWYEWYPEEPEYFDIDVNEGDLITMEVEAYSKNSGIAWVLNESTGQKAFKTFEDKSDELCLRSAEWIVEDPGYERNPFAKFDPVEFTDTWFEHDGDTGDLDGATIYNMNQHGKKMTGCTIDDGNNKLFCYYTGPRPEDVRPEDE